MVDSMKIPAACLAVVTIVFVWSAFGPYDRATWWLEVSPVLIALPLLLATYKKFPLTTLLYILVAVHSVILIVGGHYTYARVPFMDFIGEGRNNYDKIGHFAQGFIPAIAARELLLRTSPLWAGKWLVALIVFSCMGVSAVYELIEWATAEIAGDGSVEFLGTQGDVWDAQKDMMWCGIGAITALLTLSKLHNRGLEKVSPARR
jgi:putative membrane protein